MTRSILALLSAAALMIGSIAPTYARSHSPAYCHEYARHAMSDDSGAWIIIPAIVIGAAAGYGIGAAVAGLSLSAGTVAGGATGATVGVFGTSHHQQRVYEEAYAACRAGHI